MREERETTDDKYVHGVSQGDLGPDRTAGVGRTAQATPAEEGSGGPGPGPTVPTQKRKS